MKVTLSPVAQSQLILGDTYRISVIKWCHSTSWVQIDKQKKNPNLAEKSNVTAFQALFNKKETD